MNYRLLIFDADDTLLDFKKAEQFSLRLTLNDLNIPYHKNYLSIFSTISKNIWIELENGKILLENLNNERFSRFCKAINIDLGKISPMAISYANHLKDCSFLIDGASELLKALCEKYVIIIVTNGISSIQRSRILNSPLSPYIYKIITSEEVGYPKPNIKIFESSLLMGGLENRKEALIIGDSLTSDISGGNAAGIDTLWFNPLNLPNNSDSIPTYIAYSYKDIEKLLL